MALTKADIDSVAERVLDLAKERSEGDMEKWKAEREEKRKSPDGLALRVTALENADFVSWPALCIAGVAFSLLMAIATRPRD